MRISLILFTCIALSSCRHTKTLTEYKEVVRIDSIKSEKIVEKFRAVHDTLVIPFPCDSTGILTSFYSRLILPNGVVTIKSYKGQIKAQVDIDGTKTETQNNYRNSQSKLIQYKDKVIIKEVVPTWVVMLLFAEAIMLLAYIYLKFGLHV